MPRIVRVDMLVVWMFFLLLLDIPLALLVANYFERSAILESGQRADAIVAGHRHGKGRWGPTCTTVFGLRAGDRIYRIEQLDECPDEWRTGKAVEFAFDPADPGGAFLVSEGSWFRGKGWIAAALVVALLAFSAYLLPPAFREPRKPSQNRVDERRRRP